VRLADESDRAAFRQWFVLLADAQFYKPSPDIADCAALVRYAAREALREHSPEWLRRVALPLANVYPDVRSRPRGMDGHLPLFRVSATDVRYAEFADARTLIAFNTRRIARDPVAARPGDLLYFQQPEQDQPDHVMIFVGPSPFEATGDDWVVYHTGPIDGRAGEIRKARLIDLLRHPSPQWRPHASNRRFAGVFRWTFL
jgi:uncharacterized protein YfaT (DUF1175 family)